MVAHTCKPSIQEAEAGDHKVEVILGCIKKEKESRVGDGLVTRVLAV